MADCLQVWSVGSPNFPIPSNSAVASSVSATVKSYNYQIQSFAPTMPNVSFGAVVGGSGFGGISDGVRPDMADPAYHGTQPDLLEAFYQAATDAVNFAFQPPVVPQVGYSSGKGHLQLPDVTPSPAPVVYPQEAIPDLPPEPIYTIETAPSITIDAAPDLQAIQILDYNPTHLEPFELTAVDLGDWPDVDDVDYLGYVEFDEDADFRERLKELMRGDGVLRDWVLTLPVMQEADTRTVRIESKKEADKAFVEAAARNFPLAAGFVDAVVIEVEEKALEKRFEAATKGYSEVAEDALKVVATAISMAARVEKYHIANYLSYIHRNVKLYRINTAIAQAGYNALVEIYNMAAQITSMEVEEFNRYVQAIQEQNRAAAGRADLMGAQVENFGSRIGMFEAQVGVLRSAARVLSVDGESRLLPLTEYTALIQGKVAQLGVVKENIKSYMQAVDNYSKAGRWLDDVVGAYEAAVQAESSKVGVTEANIRAFREMLSTEKGRISDYKNYVQESFSVLDAEMRRYNEAMSAQRKYLGEVTQAVEVSAQTIGTYADFMRQKGSAVQHYNAAHRSYAEARDRLGLAGDNNSMLQQSLNNSALVEKERIRAAIEAIKAKTGGALAQAAASISQVSVSAAAKFDESVSRNANVRNSLSYSSKTNWSKSCVSEARALKG